jgi:hypothetical protein
MIVYPKLPSGHVIFCDDIRHEVGGKVTFVGVYTGYMYVNGTLPVALPKLCFGIVYRQEVTAADPVTIKVFVPGYEEPVAETRLDPEPQMNLPPEGEFIMHEARLFVEAAPVLIREEGRIMVRAYRGDDEIRLGVLTIQLAEATPEHATSTEE